MKDKTKKMLAGIGLGAALGTSGIFMTGCSMSDEQQAALDSIVSKADEIIELVDNQNKELSYAEAIRLFEYSRMRLVTNKDNVWDNIAVTIKQSVSEEGLIDVVDMGISHFYKFENGKRVGYSSQITGGVEGEIDGWFNEVVEEQEKSNGGDGTQSMLSYTTYSYYVRASVTSVIDRVVLDETKIVDCVVNESGNYIISAALTIEEDGVEYPSLIDMEITNDGFLLSYDINAGLLGYEKSERAYVVNTTSVKYEYGKLTDTEVQSYIDKYKVQEGFSK